MVFEHIWTKHVTGVRGWRITSIVFYPEELAWHRLHMVRVTSWPKSQLTDSCLWQFLLSSSLGKGSRSANPIFHAHQNGHITHTQNCRVGVIILRQEADRKFFFPSTHTPWSCFVSCQHLGEILTWFLLDDNVCSLCWWLFSVMSLRPSVTFNLPTSPPTLTNVNRVPALCPALCLAPSKHQAFIYVA